ncbi:serine/threonine-protein phosphatase 6 regulatory ankyrin repeat subunit C-like [Benincasa hispida]|uniref:serine/threonine-protein phosphatase 6 regulatory ankyrin repeat subunit C-like n=1 Tax=Benincasa hispida TaxID=102211 RepID=UPI001901E32F|nr:serine/threonine-protein phosphatase 6 regulatory ankyrin repeat subunit C-like [Benincasa hispida]
MATLENKLQEAAMKGNVEKMLELLQQALRLLDTLVPDPSTHGHTEFPDRILQQKPQLARVLDSKGSCPLHLAAAEGHVEIVRLLLQVDSHACLFRNADGWNPLQLAAVNGHVDVLKELVRARPDAARARTVIDHGGNALHLCVKNNQLEALKVLVVHAVDYGFLNDKDDFGCSILQLAVSYKQTETIKFLVNTNGMELNDLFQSNKEENDSTIAEVTGAIATSPPTSHSDSKNSWSRQQVMSQREALMVVASVVATMAFQAAINPPNGVWKDAEKSTIHPYRFAAFVSSITFSFVFSIIELFLLISDYPSTMPLLLSFLWLAKILSIGGMTVAYGIAILCLS